MSKEKVYITGSYSRITLVKAREKWDAAKDALSIGIDSSAQKQENKQLAKCKAAQTLELVTNK